MSSSSSIASELKECHGKIDFARSQLIQAQYFITMGMRSDEVKKIISQSIDVIGAQLRILQQLASCCT